MSLTVLEQRKAMFENGELQREFVKQLITPQALEAISGFLASPAMKQVFAFQQRFASGVIKFLQTPEMQSGLKAIEGFAASPQFHQVVRSVAEFSAAMERFAGSPLGEYLMSGRGPDLEKIVAGAGDASVVVAATCEARVVTGEQLELERQVVEHLENGKAVDSLSDTQKARLWSVMQLIQMLIIWLATQNGVREELCFFQPKLSSALSASQVGKAVRNFMCERDAPLEILRNYRTVKGTGVRLRVDPSMKAAEVQVTLEDRALLEVLDGSNRDWLHVSVIGEEGLEGWISRKYTHRLLQ
ncbi:SH3 domain-containing protein [Pseudomonas simiae]|uniref:SH3 domain-containing protein n=1 Tax=Pseudomonas simiae TaxID=321846 RepID=UPI0027346E1D|nr:SH3 domain-containing protein [Pseudomonas simiae]WLG73575.1 SH3 domain-containing protein [Pseudomonas simiae]WLH17943.1 SH3 domain-containing protein [Pseudomonas simiae]